MMIFLRVWERRNRNNMNIGLIGYGKMGKLLEAIALEKSHKIMSIMDPLITEEKSPMGTPVFKSLNALTGLLGNLDVALVFSPPNTVVKNLCFFAKVKIPTVVGSTGWYDRLPEVSAAVKDARTSMFWAPNFSLGMNLFYRIAAYAAEIFDPFSEYDVGGMEVHHNKKADSPSGTAKLIAEKMLEKMNRKKKAVYEKLDGLPGADELHFASLRVGSVQGVHSIIFDSPADTVELSHTLRNREGLAAGTLQAAEWLCSEKRSGVFTMDDMLSDIMQRSSHDILKDTTLFRR
jgi:4-hydroxy-tetrahydrodipicolinate reductase